MSQKQQYCLLYYYFFIFILNYFKKDCREENVITVLCLMMNGLSLNILIQQNKDYFLKESEKTWS